MSLSCFLPSFKSCLSTSLAHLSHNSRTRKIKSLEENVGSLHVKLTPEDIAGIRAAVDNAEVHGNRYPKTLAYGLFADTPELEEDV